MTENERKLINLAMEVAEMDEEVTMVCLDEVAAEATRNARNILIARINKYRTFADVNRLSLALREIADSIKEERKQQP